LAGSALGRGLSGPQPGRTNAGQVTVFDSVGVALEDFSAVRYRHAAAIGRGMGERMALIPPRADPKDLFGALRQSAANASHGAAAPGLEGAQG